MLAWWDLHDLYDLCDLKGKALVHMFGGWALYDAALTQHINTANK